MWVFIYGDVVMRQHKIFFLYKQNILCCCIITSPYMNTHISVQWFWLGTHELPDDDQLLIETHRSAFKCFSVWHFKLLFYYIEVHLLAHYNQGKLWYFYICGSNFPKKAVTRSTIINSSSRWTLLSHFTKHTRYEFQKLLKDSRVRRDTSYRQLLLVTWTLSHRPKHRHFNVTAVAATLHT
jgi:hypothetical protein